MTCKLFCLKILHISLLTASTCLGIFVQVAGPSSVYNPTLTSRWVIGTVPSARKSLPHRHYPLLHQGPTLFCVMSSYCYKECFFVFQILLCSSCWFVSWYVEIVIFMDMLYIFLRFVLEIVWCMSKFVILN